MGSAAWDELLGINSPKAVLTGENRGSGWVDKTGDSIERAKARLVELESLLTEKGSATISKP
jgi:hypothetical protein